MKAGAMPTPRSNPCRVCARPAVAPSGPGSFDKGDLGMCTSKGANTLCQIRSQVLQSEQNAQGCGKNLQKSCKDLEQPLIFLLKKVMGCSFQSQSAWASEQPGPRLVRKSLLQECAQVFFHTLTRLHLHFCNIQARKTETAPSAGLPRHGSL